MKKQFISIVLKTITCIMGFIFIIAGCAMDSEDLTIPIIGILTSGTWLTLSAYVNGWMYDTEPYFERQVKDSELDR